MTKLERLRKIIEKPYVKLPLILGALLYAGFVAVLLFVALTSLYALATLLGVPTLQLLTGAVSAASAAASASAAVLIWRGNVQARKTVLIDRVLGPAYSEIRRGGELLEAWKDEAKDAKLSTPFLNTVESDWRYYTLDSRVRTDLENFKGLVETLDQQRDVAKSVAGPIVIKAASDTFGVQNASTVYLWRSHSWQEGQTQGENGRMPAWELLMDSPPLNSPTGYYVHSLQVVDFNNTQQFTLPLLNQKKERLNADKFHKFWELARALAAAENAVAIFRETRDRTRKLGADLEKKLDSEIRHLR